MKTEAVNTPLTEEERTQLKALLSVDSVHGEVIPLLDFLLSLRDHRRRRSGVREIRTASPTKIEALKSTWCADLQELCRPARHSASRL